MVTVGGEIVKQMKGSQWWRTRGPTDLIILESGMVTLSEMGKVIF